MLKKILSTLLVLVLVTSVSIVLANNVSQNDKVSAELNEVISRHVNNYVYQKDTVINLNEKANFELKSIFHAGSSVLKRTTYYNVDELWMSNGIGSYSYYGTSPEGLTNASEVKLGDTTDDVAIKGTTMEEYYYTLRDVVATDEQHWTVENGVYSSTNSHMIEVFKGFVAPCYLGFNEKTKNYIIFTGVEIEEVEGKLVLRLMCDSLDDDKLVDGANGVFAIATISKWSLNYVITSGNLSESEGEYTTAAPLTLAVAQDVVMEDNKKYSIEYTPGASHDGGLVFGLNDNGETEFWEKPGVYYYMLMINGGGTIFLAKIDGRTGASMWSVLDGNSYIKNIDWTKTYTLSVVTNGNNVKGYVDDMLMFSFDCPDTFAGTKLGFRSAISGATYSAITTSQPNTGYEFYQRSGQFENNNGTLSTTVDGGLAWITNASLTVGTFSADITASVASDTGLVFGCSDPVAARWEQKPYYFFFVNKDNIAFLGGPIPNPSVPNSKWTEFANGGNVSEYLNPYGQANNLKVEIHENYLIKCYVNGHLVIRTTITNPDLQLTGTYAGVRCVGQGSRVFSNITITDTVTPEVVKKVIFKADGEVVAEVPYIVGETKSVTAPIVPFKEYHTGAWEAYTLGTEDVIVNAVYTLNEDEVPGYITTWGSVTTENDIYTTVGATLGVAKNIVMQDGVKYSVEYTPGASHDGGLVFGLNDNGETEFWEKSGVYYYMLMVNGGGVIFLAKIDGRTGASMWSVLDEKSNIKNIDWSKTYTLSVVTNGNNVKGYVDDMLMFSFDCPDTFAGTKLGFRSAIGGAKYSIITTSEPNTGYEFYQRSGQFENNNGTLTTSVDGGLAWITNQEFTKGTFSADITASQGSDTGLVFGCSDPVGARWEQKPYYLFFITAAGDAILAGPLDGWVTVANGGNVSEYLNPYGQPNNYKVEVLDNFVIKCYVNGHLVITVEITNPAYQLTGTYAGVRSVGAGSREFSNITITKN